MKNAFILFLIFFTGSLSLNSQKIIEIDFEKDPPNKDTELPIKSGERITFKISKLKPSPIAMVNQTKVHASNSTDSGLHTIVLTYFDEMKYKTSSPDQRNELIIDLTKTDDVICLEIKEGSNTWKKWNFKVTIRGKLATSGIEKENALSPINDAIVIANAFKEKRPLDGEKTLSRYSIDPSNIQKNPYLSHFEPELNTGNSLQIRNEGLSTSIMGLLASSSQSLVPEAAALDGIAQFLVKRFKAEINVWFLDGFKAKLDAIPGLKILLPETYQAMTLSDPYNYPIFLQTFREAFQSDLKDLYKNFIVLLNDQGEMTHLLTELNIGINYIELKPAIDYINLASFIDQSLRDGEDLPDVIEGLPDNYDSDDNLAGALNLAALLSKGMRDESGDWVSASKVPLLYDKDIIEFKRQPFWIFWGLIHQIDLDSKQMDKVSFDNGAISLRDFLDKMTVAKFKTFFSAFQTTARNGITTFNQGKALQQQYEQNGTLNIESFDPFVLSTLDFVGEGVNLAMVITGPGNAGLCKVKHQILPATKEIWGAVAEADKKNYALGLNHIVSAFNIITDKSLGVCPVAGTEALQAKQSGWGKELIKYGSFMVTMINAKTADDVEAALESAALPVGSYTIKRQNHLTMGINAWVGPSVGIEHLTDKAIPTNASNKTSISLMAPIGPYISLGPNSSSFVPKCDKVIWKPSFFLMVSVLDLGALVNFRLQDSSALDLPEITFKNFLAPGVHLGINPFPRAPLSLGGYWQYGPIARSVSTSSVGTSAGWKAGIWLGVDISIFNFYTRPDSKAKSKWYRSGG